MLSATLTFRFIFGSKSPLLKSRSKPTRSEIIERPARSWTGTGINDASTYFSGERGAPIMVRQPCNWYRPTQSGGLAPKESVPPEIGILGAGWLAVTSNQPVVENHPCPVVRSRHSPPNMS